MSSSSSSRTLSLQLTLPALESLSSSSLLEILSQPSVQQQLVRQLQQQLSTSMEGETQQCFERPSESLETRSRVVEESESCEMRHSLESKAYERRSVVSTHDESQYQSELMALLSLALKYCEKRGSKSKRESDVSHTRECSSLDDSTLVSTSAQSQRCVYRCSFVQTQSCVFGTNCLHGSHPPHHQQCYPGNDQSTNQWSCHNSIST